MIIQEENARNKGIQETEEKEREEKEKRGEGGAARGGSEDEEAAGGGGGGPEGEGRRGHPSSSSVSRRADERVERIRCWVKGAVAASVSAALLYYCRSACYILAYRGWHDAR